MKNVGGGHTAPYAQNPFQTPRQRIQKTRKVRDKTTCKETIIPKALSGLHHMTFPTGSLSTIKQKKTGRRDWNFSMTNTI